MASYMSNYCLNLAADHVTNRTIQLRAHSASPGNSGTGSRIGTADVDVAASGWGPAASGSSDINADAAFGVLSTTGSNTVSYISKWDGANFLGHVTMSTNVVVPANDSFTLNSGQVSVDFARP